MRVLTIWLRERVRLSISRVSDMNEPINTMILEATSI